VQLEAIPPLADSELAAIRIALARSGLRFDGQPPIYTSNWRRVAVREAVEKEPEIVRYARSPRSTPGATRA
jgi:uncharacterized ferritin-like protein (DUF455 family)